LKYNFKYNFLPKYNLGRSVKEGTTPDLKTSPPSPLLNASPEEALALS